MEFTSSTSRRGAIRLQRDSQRALTKNFPAALQGIV